MIKLSGRKLVFEDQKNNLILLFIRNKDVPVYVEYGACDIGVVGKDILLELESDVYELYDLQLGKCKICVAGLKEGVFKYKAGMRVATKYPNITKKFFMKKGYSIDAIELYGSIEVAPLLGLSDLIVDLVSTGETLRKNGLTIAEIICLSTARLIANKNLTRIKFERIRELLNYLCY